MRFELFVARRIFADRSNRRSASQTIVRIALGSIALSLAVMLLAVAIVTGFKREIDEKISGFGSHVRVKYFDTGESLENPPVLYMPELVRDFEAIRHVRHVQPYGMKGGILKTDDDIHGVVLKGVDTRFDWSFFEKYLKEGRLPRYTDSVRSTEVMVSEQIAKLLRLEIGHSMRVYFIQDPPRVRKLDIVGIYNTGLEMYDQAIVLCHLAQIQRLNDWEPNQVSGYEILIDDFAQLDAVRYNISLRVSNDFTASGDALRVETVRDIKPELFTWLELTDMNVVVIIVLMLVVSGVNMISSLLILILERTRMIGTLKALGANNRTIRGIFLYNAAMLVGKGMLWGNIVGLGLALLQYFYHVVPLDPATYYVDTVPININLWHVLWLNVGTLAAIVSMLLLPSYIVTKISPIRAIRFE